MNDLSTLTDEQQRRYEIEKESRVKLWRESGIQPDMFVEMDCVAFRRVYHNDRDLAAPYQIVYVTSVRYEEGMAGIILWGGTGMVVTLDILRPFERRAAQLVSVAVQEGQHE